MPAFELEKRDVTIRGRKVVVREMTHDERMDYVGLLPDQKKSAYFAVATCTVDPSLTQEEVAGQSGHVTEQLLRAILDISGLVASKEKQKEKQADAGGAAPLPAGDSNGAVTE